MRIVFVGVFFNVKLGNQAVNFLLLLACEVIGRNVILGVRSVRGLYQPARCAVVRADSVAAPRQRKGKAVAFGCGFNSLKAVLVAVIKPVSDFVTGLVAVFLLNPVIACGNQLGQNCRADNQNNAKRNTYGKYALAVSLPFLYSVFAAEKNFRLSFFKSSHNNCSPSFPRMMRRSFLARYKRLSICLRFFFITLAASSYDKSSK